MRNFILADNQELTGKGLIALMTGEEHHLSHSFAKLVDMIYVVNVSGCKITMFCATSQYPKLRQMLRTAKQRVAKKDYQEIMTACFFYTKKLRFLPK